MKLISLQMANFRQFYGETPRIWLADGERNITVFHGANGSGKTTVLNALTWLFYDEFTDAFASPSFLINKKALKEARIGDQLQCCVELTFEHHSRKYVLKRAKDITKTSDPHGYSHGSEKLTMYSVGEDGRYKEVEADQIPDVVGRILPEKLLPYFFFDGERIESLQRSNKQPDVIAATTMFVGEEVINRAIKHLTEARKHLEADLKKIGDAETSHLLDEKAQIESDLQTLLDRQQQWEKNLAGYQAQKAAIDKALRELDSAKEMQKRRDLLTNQRDQLTQSLNASQNSLASLVSTHGYQAYLHGAVKSFREIITGLRRKGELPASIKATFVEELLRSGRCICGRHLTPGEDPYKEVEVWLKRGGMSDVEEVALRMEAEINQVEREVPNLFTRLDQEQQARARTREQLSKVQDELDKIGEALRGSREEDTRNLENQRIGVEEGIDRTRRYQLEDQNQIRGLESRLNHLDSEITRRQGINDRHELANHRLVACRNAISTLQAVKAKLRTNFREDLMGRINDLFSKMSYKPYRAVLDADYCLSLVDGPTSTPVGPSTGESALLSLSFIGAVINQARELTAKRDRLPGPDSSVFPVVMDSPFGSLDPVYRRQVAQNLPALANQVVVMLSKTQFQGEVENTMHAKIGKEYVLRYHSPRADAHEDQIARYGATYELVKRSPDEDEWTEIVEVMRVG